MGGVSQNRKEEEDGAATPPTEGRNAMEPMIRRENILCFDQDISISLGVLKFVLIGEY